ncbi:eCIS core domain-containing protein [Motilibacter deserti]|uniref:eCIS core domain-containing protein n=1 Tax=Motilibacter deserti TaxID=2714956 RepID=UPI0018C8B084|nr:DUF4157 domain-containing protein [Motilibacter deserti]
MERTYAVPGSSRPEQRARPHAAAHPGRAALLALQRSAGNAATTRLVQARGRLPEGTRSPRPVPPVAPAEPAAAGNPAGSAEREWRHLLDGILAVTGYGGVGPVPAPRTGAASPLRAAAATVHEQWGRLGPGVDVPAGLRAPFEQSYGYDLSGARMHIGGAAARGVTSAFGVQALTVDNHMVFAADPSRRVLGHELAHVVQQGLRAAPPANGSMRAAPPGSAVERDADAATDAALAGGRHRLRAAGDEDVSMLAPLAIAAIAALVVGAGIAIGAELAGPSYEENQRRAEERRRDPSLAAWAEASWLWVPLGGTATRIWQAQSPVERYLNVAMMPLDVLTLGALGSAAMKISSLGLWRTAVSRAAPAELAALGREGVTVATKAEVQAQARAALEAGQAVVASVGRRGHALVFVQVEGQLYRLTGGALRTMAVRSMESFAPRSINAFHALGGTEASARIFAEAQMLARTWGPGLGFSFRSCGLSTARLAESGLLSTGSVGLGLGGGRAYLPVTVIGALAERGGVTLSQEGARRMLMGTGLQFALLGTARSAVTVVANPESFAASLVELLVPSATELVPTQSSADDASARDPLAELEASTSDLDTALTTEEPGADGIGLASIPDAYVAVQNRVALAAGGGQRASHTLELEPHYTFLATAHEESRQPPEDMGEVLDLRGADGATEAGAQAHLDHDWLVHVSGTPEYVDGALRFVDDLAAAVDQEDHDGIVDRVASYFPAASPRPAERTAAAAMALERAGLSGADLDAARSRLVAAGG